ncbi:hypothetical protein [Streptomyces sp. 891-h]|uniref:hypothetical protein n=1 Tax=unclassified Streptomyces TaxID=2593676 RepID=UPI001FA98E6F|nr:hypothetical protein [Streptomyces sp. 891-h]UNZ17684.1 hypothetical protein HC362_12085 [Streptomyces sp. 891-h]
MPTTQPSWPCTLQLRRAANSGVSRFKREEEKLKVRKLIGVVVAALAMTAMASAPASADEAVTGGNVEMVIFGSGYHVSSVTIHGVPEPQGPAQYEFIYYATTSPTKTHTMICGGSSTGGSCSHKFSINATYAGGVGIRSCGSIKRVDNQQILGTACKKW